MFISIDAGKAFDEIKEKFLKNREKMWVREKSEEGIDKYHIYSLFTK